MRIVTESASAAGRIHDHAVPYALRQHRFGVTGVTHECQHTGVMRATIRHTAQRGDQFRIVARVGFRLAGIARALHSRRAAECPHAQAGIIGQRRQVGVCARVPRLGERVLDKRRVRLVGVGDGEFRLRDQVDGKRRQQPAEFAQLAFVAAREDEARDRHPACPRQDASLIADRCAAISARIPRSASVTSASISSRENGDPSAVPWSSTNPPDSVITTFMSVSQPESSA